jgi:hypothetical protein
VSKTPEQGIKIVVSLALGVASSVASVNTPQLAPVVLLTGLVTQLALWESELRDWLC